MSGSDQDAAELAEALAEARAAAVPAPTARRPIDIDVAHRTADLLYAQLRREGARQIGWKLGATDAKAREKLGTDRPFVAPVHDTMSAPLGNAVELGRLIAPRLEVELGVDLAGPEPVARPTVEIADSRLPGWISSLPEAIADFGAQGLMLIGDPVAGVERLSAEVWHDGERLASGAVAFADALALARDVDRSGAPPEATFVATGTVVAPLPLTPGHWRIDFGELGSVELDARP